jgi:hypothetical protein
MGFGVDGLYPDSCDSSCIHARNGEAAAFEVDGFAFFGDVAQAHEEEPGQGFDAAFTG